MRLLEIEIQNLKLLENVKENFNGNIIYITGDNKKGKTTFVQAISMLMEAKWDNKFISFGKEKAYLKGTFQSANGDLYTAEIIAEREKSPKFILSTIDGKVYKKVSDIRDIFDYNFFSAEKFVSWGETSEGRIRQRDIFLDIIGKEKKELFLNYKAKEKEHYDNRRDVGRDIKKIKGKLDSYKLTDEEIDKINNKKKAEELLSELRKKREKALAEEYKIKNIKKDKENSINSLNRVREILLEYENDTLDSELTVISGKINSFFESILKDKEDSNIESLDNRIATGEEMIRQISVLENKKNNYDNTKKELDDLEEKYKNHDSKIEEYRRLQKDILKNANIPIENIVIEDDGLYYEEEGNILPFTEEHLSTSLIYLITAKIILLLNKKSPICFLGKAAELGDTAMKELIDYVNDIGGELFIDKVVSGEDFKIVVDEKNSSIRAIEDIRDTFSSQDRLDTTKEKKSLKTDENEPKEIKGGLF